MKNTLFILLLITFGVQAQTDQLRFTTYNLLNYRNYTTYCTASNNSPTAKDQNLNTIVKYLQPDILVCNEIGGASAQTVDLLFNNAINANGVTKYAKGQYTNNGFSDLVNMVFYNTEKVVLDGQNWITKDLNNNNLVRVIDVYRFYYKDSLLTAQSDTVFFSVIAAHLKAGNSGSDAADRALAAAAIMDYVHYTLADQNVFLMGDLNTYKSQEACYQTITNFTVASSSFKDPINSPGVWNNNSAFAGIHTQSTHTSGGCFSTGGLDDRFDHILVSPALLSNADGMEYATNTYKAVGNDGLHFNKSLTDNTNNSVPSHVLTALYNMSDHLPVAMEVLVKTNSIGLPHNTITASDIVFKNPAFETLDVWVKTKKVNNANCVLTDLSGRQILTQALQRDNGRLKCTIELDNIKNGLYFLTVVTQNGAGATQKVLIQ